MSKMLWRISPPLWLGQRVRELAMSEGRTDSSMLVRLISEAVNARAAIEARTPGWRR
jgi:hypothetical protein